MTLVYMLAGLVGATMAMFLLIALIDLGFRAMPIGWPRLIAPAVIAFAIVAIFTSINPVYYLLGAIAVTLYRYHNNREAMADDD